MLEGQAVAHAAGPPSPRRRCCPREGQGPMQPGTDAVAGVARAKLKSVTNCLRDSDSGFDLGVYSRSLSTHGVNRETAVVWNQSFLLLNGLPTQGIELRLPGF